MSDETDETWRAGYEAPRPPYTTEEIIAAYPEVFGPTPEKPMPSAQRAEKRKERPKVELKGTYLVPEDTDARLEQIDREIDRNIEESGSSEEFERLLSEQDALWEKRYGLESGVRSERERTAAEIAKRKKAVEALDVKVKDSALPKKQREDAFADLMIEQAEQRDIESAAPFAGLSDTKLTAAAEDARVALEEATERANALPAGSTRRARADREVPEAHRRALALEGELRRRKDRAALDAHAEKRTAELTEKKVAEHRQAVIRDAEQSAEPAWFLEKLRAEAEQPPTKKEIATARAEVEAELLPRIRDYARFQAVRRNSSSR